MELILWLVTTLAKTKSARNLTVWSAPDILYKKKSTYVDNLIEKGLHRAVSWNTTACPVLCDSHDVPSLEALKLNQFIRLIIYALFRTEAGANLMLGRKNVTREHKQFCEIKNPLSGTRFPQVVWVYGAHKNDRCEQGQWGNFGIKGCDVDERAIGMPEPGV